MPRVLIVTGETSGDLHGANLALALKTLRRDIHLLGVGGGHMHAAGVELLPGLEPVDAIGILGVAQIRRGIGNFLKLRHVLRKEQFDAVVLIDSPGLNLRLASVAVKAGHRVIYYIAPQVWAWGRHRLQSLAQIVHRMIVILPFEEPLFRQAGVPCTFVGHPLLDTMAPSYDQSALRQEFGLSVKGLVLGLFPGSREREVRALLPAMVQAGMLMQDAFPGLQGIIGLAPSISERLMTDLTRETNLPLTIIRHRSNDVMAASTLLLVASGTATLQAALIGTPMVIAYRVSWLTYHMAKRVIQIPHIGLVNVLAGHEIVPELIQDEATGKRLSEEGLRILRDHNLANQKRTVFRDIRRQLGASGASMRAAKVVLAECKG